MSATVEDLRAHARRLLASGDPQGAVQLYEDILGRSGDDIEALNILAMTDLGRGNAQAGLAKIRRALTGQPHHALSLTHSGAIRMVLGDAEGAESDLHEAIALEPSSFVARLHHGLSLRALGRTREAWMELHRSILLAQQHGQWLGPDTTPAGLRQTVVGAMRMVDAARQEVFEGVLGPLRARYGSGSLRRVEACLAGHLGTQVARFTDDRQRPLFLFVPDVPAQPYFEREQFPWMSTLEEQTDAIAAEMRTALAGNEGQEQVFLKNPLQQAYLRGRDAEPSWRGYYFYRHGVRRENNCVACPQTTAALEQLPLARIRAHAPEIMYSVLTAGTHLLPHRGVTNMRVVLHLPLLIPRNCALNVGGQQHVWRRGEAVVFDDTYAHEAWNRSETTRVILIADIWNPHLDEAERAAFAELVPVISEERRELVVGGDTLAMPQWQDPHH